MDSRTLLENGRFILDGSTFFHIGNPNVSDSVEKVQTVRTARIKDINDVDL